jgi:SAM-dependent methyltransferase
MEVGLRKGKKRSIHLPAKVLRGNNGSACILGLHGGKLGRIEKGHRLIDGEAWVIIVPHVGNGDLAQLEVLRAEERILYAKFTSDTLGIVEIILDNRGRALNLVTRGEYSINVLPWKKFFEMYERRSIPYGKSGRSEPAGVAGERIRNFEEIATQRGGIALDVATGLKDYLRTIKERCLLICGNISPSMLRRTKAWLGGGAFIAYDVEAGLPFKEESFGLVICDALLEYVDDALGVLTDIARLVCVKGELLLLEPISSLGRIEEFYPQDLWEMAIWRPINEKTFSRYAFEELLVGMGFRETGRRTMVFEYPIYGNERFRQDVVRFAKL